LNFCTKKAKEPGIPHLQMKGLKKSSTTSENAIVDPQINSAEPSSLESNTAVNSLSEAAKVKTEIFT